MKTLTHEKVVARLKKLQNGRTAEDFAQEIGFSGGYLSDVYAGKRGLGIVICTYLRIRKNPPTYSEVEEK